MTNDGRAVPAPSGQSEQSAIDMLARGASIGLLAGVGLALLTVASMAGADAFQTGGGTSRWWQEFRSVAPLAAILGGLSGPIGGLLLASCLLTVRDQGPRASTRGLAALLAGGVGALAITLLTAVLSGGRASPGTLMDSVMGVLMTLVPVVGGAGLGWLLSPLLWTRPTRRAAKQPHPDVR